MTISFNQIVNLNIPFVSVEFDNSQASQGPAIQPHTVLCMGQKLSTGSQAELTLITVTSEAQAISLFGRGSMLHWMVKRYLQNNTVTELKVVAIDDAAAGVAATGKIAIDAGTATADGTLQVYIAGQRVSTAVATGDDQDAVATALAAAITADLDLQVTAAVNGSNANEVDITARHKGLVGNKINLRVNLNDDDEYPAGITATITAMASGTTNPDVQEILDVLPEDQYNTVVNPWVDSANLTALETYLATQFGPDSAKDGFAIAYDAGSLSTLQALGNARNSPHSSISTYATDLIESPWEMASMLAGRVALAAQVDPARPFQTLPIVGATPVPAAERFIDSERNILISDGIATMKVVGGIVQIERLVSTYQTNTAAQADDSLQDANTLYTLSYLRYSFRQRFASKFPRHKLVDDGNRVAPGQAVMTPSIARAEAISLFGDWQEAVLVENLDQFVNDLVVERNAANPNRLDFLLPPDLANQLRQIAAQVQFRL